MANTKKSSKSPAKNKKELSIIKTHDILKPITIDMLGTNYDPCFGKLYDLSTDECKMCGDSELCCIVLAQGMNKTREQLEKEKHFKDLDTLIDIPSVKKFIRKQSRAGVSKREIIKEVQAKFEITRQDARDIYKSYKSSKNATTD